MNILLGEIVLESASILPQESFMPGSFPQIVQSQAEVTWNNSTLIKENIAEEVSKLKHEVGQDILLLGSRDLVHTLMQHDLIDEYDLTIFPIVLGSGKRLFREGINTTLRLVESKTYKTGVVALTYQPERKE